ncbi:MAG: DUF433 domain-containing protein, partial [Pyrinomonadaceae bacterium]
VMVGKPVIRGTRLTVEHILNLLAHGATIAEIIEEYKGLTQEDVQACILFATKSLENTDLMRRAHVTILDDGPTAELSETALLSEQSLAEDWNRQEEDEAWSHLQSSH